MSYFLKNTIIAVGLLTFINSPLLANDDPEVREVDSLKAQASKRVAHYLIKKYELSPKSSHPLGVTKLGKKLRGIGDRVHDLDILDDTISFLPGHAILQLLSNNMAKEIMGEALWKKVSTHIPNGLKLKKESGYWSLSKGLGIDGNILEGIRNVGRSLTNLESLKIDDLPDNELVDLLSLPIMRGLREFRASTYEPRSERVGRALGRLGVNRLRIFDIGCVKISPHDNLAISCNFNLITIPNLTLIPHITMDEGKSDSLYGSGNSHSRGYCTGKGRGYVYSL